MLGLGLSIPRCAVRAGNIIAPQIVDILRKYGTDAHVYLPGIGVINGLTAGNYLDSAGTTAATVDNPVGLVLDAANSQLGSELVTNGTFTTDTTGWTTTAGSLTIESGRGKLQNSGAVSALSSTPITTVVGKTYKATLECQTITDLSANRLYVGTTAGAFNLLSLSTDNGDKTLRTLTGYFVATGTTSYVGISNSAITDAISYYDNVSVKEVTGIHAIQATTANKPILRQESFGYSWQFDSTDVLVSTGGTFGADMDCFMGLYADVAIDAAALFNAHLGSSFFGVWQSAATVAHLNSGSPTYKVNGVSVTGGASVTRSQLKAAIPNKTFCVFEANNLNMSSGWSSFSLGKLAHDYHLVGKCSIVVLVPALSESDTLIMRKFVGALSGVQI